MISIISATNRANSLSYKVAVFYSEMLTEKGVENKVLSLCDLPSDFMFSNAYGESTQPFQDIVDSHFSCADKFVVVSPEYHGSYPGIFKALVDCLGAPYFQTKKVALVGVATGRSGNLRGMEHLTSLFHHLKAEVFSSKPKLSEVHKLMDDHGRLTNAETISLLQDQIDRFLKF